MKKFGKISVAVALCAMGIGIVILFVSFIVIKGNGGVREYNYQMKDTVVGVESLEINVNYGEMFIEEGNEFSIRVEHMMEDSFQSEVVNGVWKISNEIDEQNSIYLFGWRIPINLFGTGILDDYYYSPDIYITLPRDFVAKNLRVSVEAGSLEAERLDAERAYLQIGAGSVEIQEFRASISSNYQVGVGELIINNFTAHNIEMENGVGSIYVDGVITGDNFIKCGIGDINLDLRGDEEDYNYDLNCGIGTIMINNFNGGFGENSTIYHKDAKNSFDLESGIGNISIMMN